MAVKIARFGVTRFGTYGGNGARVWRWKGGFSFKPKQGMRLGRLLPEPEEKLPHSIIVGVGFGCNDGPDAQPEHPAIPPTRK